MRIPILYVLPHGDLGGAERATLQFLAYHCDRERGASRSFDPEVILLNDGPLRSMIEALAIPVTVLPFTVRFRHPWSVLRAALWMRRLIRMRKFTVIHACMAWSHILVCLATVGMRLSTVWFQHGPVGAIWDRLASLAGASAVFCNSTYTMMRHRETAWRQASLAVIPLAVPCLSVEPNPGVRALVRRQWGIPDDALLLGGVGRLDPNKGFDRLIKACAPILHQSNGYLILVGGLFADFHHGYADQLQELARHLRVRERVIFTGFQEDVRSFYQAMDLYLHAAREEGLGLTILEAKSQNTPVVAVHTGGVPELITDGVDGYLYAEPTEQALRAGLDRALRDRERWPTIAEAALARLRRERDPAACGQILEDAYRRLLDTTASKY